MKEERDRVFVDGDQGIEWRKFNPLLRFSSGFYQFIVIFESGSGVGPTIP